MSDAMTILCVLAICASLLTTAGVVLWAVLGTKRPRSDDPIRWVAQVALQAVETNRQYAATVKDMVDGAVRANGKALDVAATRADDQAARIRAEHEPDVRTVVQTPAPPASGDLGYAFLGTEDTRHAI